MLQTILLVLLVLIVGVVLFAATRPSTFTVQRAAAIRAPAAAIFPHLEDFHAWTKWSPWEGLDPNLQRTYSGAASGKGAVYEWAGDKKVGRGRMEITDATVPSRVLIKLDFLEPFEAHNTTELALAPSGDATTVTWTMRGTNNFMLKVMGLFMNMDKMVGNDFEKGLASLKTLTEAR